MIVIANSIEGIRFTPCLTNRAVNRQMKRKNYISQKEDLLVRRTSKYGFCLQRQLVGFDDFFVEFLKFCQ